MNNISGVKLAEKEEEEEKEEAEKEKKSNKIEFIFYITLVLLLLYEIICISQRYFLNPNKIIIQKGGNQLGSDVGKGVTKVGKIVLKTVNKVAKATVKLGSKLTSGITSGVGGVVDGRGGGKGSIGYNKQKLSNGLKSMSSKISEKESYQSTMRDQEHMRGKVFIFGIIICFFGFLLVSVLPIFSIVFILIITFAFAKDEFIKFIKSFD